MVRSGQTAVKPNPTIRRHGTAAENIEMMKITPGQDLEPQNEPRAASSLVRPPTAVEVVLAVHAQRMAGRRRLRRGCLDHDRLLLVGQATGVRSGNDYRR